MKKMGLVGEAVAATLIGDVSVALAVGLETVSGKSVAPLAQSVPCGDTAAGAGNGLELGDQLLVTGGTEG